MDKIVGKVAALGVPVIALAGIVGIGYSINANHKRKKRTGTVSRSTVESTAVNVLSKSAPEVSSQADAIVVDVVNALRINHLLKELARIDRNNAGAAEEIQLFKSEVQKLLVSNRGGIKGIHGFIGETSQVHISNINAFINGDEPLYILLDDNSMTDYVRGFEIIQQKACQAGGTLGLNAIKRHMVKYPEFVEKGGIYQIPKDMFSKYEHLKNLPEDVAMKLRKEDLRLWKCIHAFTGENPDVIIEPMEVSYSDIQAGNIDNTIKRIENEAQNEFGKQRKLAHAEHTPTFGEFLKVCGISAAIEGGVNAGIEFVQKLKSGKRLSELTKQDFKDIGVKFAIGSGKGAFRGGVVYIVTNICRISTTIVSGVVTALLGICREGYLLFRKGITKEQFAKNSLFVILETGASVVGSSLGKRLCKKHHVMGSLIGGVLGSVGAYYFRRTAFA